ncbi:O-acetyl-ADP-ribose deacetylase [Undibacterium sp. Ji49W]|uniref:O-acetyl-ADP-ribose deacetylase n=1 Tax=Undibacterium sp. Ji49W TaxID=3413040 RepID=UPI003BF03CA8
MCNIIVLKGDITVYPADIIVNAANSSLLGGGGVDGAIHRKGGAAILDECRKIRARQGGCFAGNAVITTAGLLPAKYVIHAVGPRWNDGTKGEAELLQQTYQRCLHLAVEHNARSMSFPNISTGTYKFPKELAAQIASDTIFAFFEDNQSVETINIVCYEQDNYDIYQTIIKRREI